MICPGCGAVVSPDATHCSTCRRALMPGPQVLAGVLTPHPTGAPIADDSDTGLPTGIDDSDTGLPTGIDGAATVNGAPTPDGDATRFEAVPSAAGPPPAGARVAGAETGPLKVARDRLPSAMREYRRRPGRHTAFWPCRSISVPGQPASSTLRRWPIARSCLSVGQRKFRGQKHTQPCFAYCSPKFLRRTFKSGRLANRIVHRGVKDCDTPCFPGLSLRFQEIRLGDNSGLELVSNELANNALGPFFLQDRECWRCPFAPQAAVRENPTTTVAGSRGARLPAAQRSDSAALIIDEQLTQLRRVRGNHLGRLLQSRIARSRLAAQREALGREQRPRQIRPL